MGQSSENNNAFVDEQNRVETEYVKCSGCGANMQFDPATQSLHCPHCGNVTKFEANTLAQENDIVKGFSEDVKWSNNEASAFKCPNCGASVVLSAGETANECPFCGTPHVQKTNELLGLKPNAVLPFTFDAQQALKYSKDWAKKKFFAPNAFKKNLRAENLKGVYAPSFTFDSYTSSSYVGRIGKTYTRTVGSGKNRRTQTYTVWRDIAGNHFDNFDDVLISSGSKIDQQKLNKLAPFNTNASKVYDEKFLLGFMAYHYDYQLNDCWSSAKGLIDKAIERSILSKYSYDKVAYLNVSTVHQNVTYKYVMLPVYVGNFKYAKKPYNFFVNGTTGKVWGKYPLSFWKIFFTVIICLVVLLGIGYLISTS